MASAASGWGATLQWEAKSRLGDKCFLPMEAFERLQGFLTGDFADQPAPRRAPAMEERLDSSEDGDTSGERDSEGDTMMMHGVRNTVLKGKEKESLQNNGGGSGADLAPHHDRRKGQPLTLQFTNPRTGTKVFGGVLEFSSPTGVVGLSPYLVKALSLDLDDTVTVRLVNLPKGSFAKLQPLQADYLDIPDFRAALESLMRSNFTTLTQGEIISLAHQGKVHDILVSELKPSTGVSITGLQPAFTPFGRTLGNTPFLPHQIPSSRLTWSHWMR